MFRIRKFEDLQYQLFSSSQPTILMNIGVERGGATIKSSRE